MCSLGATQQASHELVHVHRNSSTSSASTKQAQGHEHRRDQGWTPQTQAKQQLLPRTQCVAGWGQHGKASTPEHSRMQTGALSGAAALRCMRHRADSQTPLSTVLLTSAGQELGLLRTLQCTR